MKASIMKYHIVAIMFLFAATLSAVNVYVDNVKGNDKSTGLRQDQALATFKQAVKLLRPGSTLHISRNDKPYKQALIFKNISGTPAKPITINGNGAIISGLVNVSSYKAIPMGEGVWRINIHKMPSNYAPSLFVSGRLLPKAVNAKTLATMQFYWDGSGFLFRPESGKKPENYKLSASILDSGIALNNSSYIVCRNLISEHHANDGVNVHGNCQGLIFSGIESRNNGDDGFSVHEDVGVTVFNSNFHHNMYGIQDINSSRSNYYGVTIKKNKVGVNLLGGVHTLVDCQIIDSQNAAVILSRGRPGMAQGKKDTGSFYGGMTYIKSCYISKGRESITICRRAKAMLIDSIIADCDNGIIVLKDAELEMRNSSVVNCGVYDLVAQGKLIADLNSYGTGKIKFANRKFNGSKDLAKYQKLSGQDKQSRILKLKKDVNGKYIKPAKK